jgi:hypothetical protein
METFDKNSPGYLGNGHYRHSDKEWMSVWTFKNKFGAPTENTNDINGREGKRLIADGMPYHKSKPDFGSFSEIFIYPVEVLQKFYDQN